MLLSWIKSSRTSIRSVMIDQYSSGWSRVRAENYAQGLPSCSGVLSSDQRSSHYFMYAGIIAYCDFAYSVRILNGKFSIRIWLNSDGCVMSTVADDFKVKTYLSQRWHRTFIQHSYSEYISALRYWTLCPKMDQVITYVWIVAYSRSPLWECKTTQLAIMVQSWRYNGEGSPP